MRRGQASSDRARAGVCRLPDLLETQQRRTRRPEGSATRDAARNSRGGILSVAETILAESGGSALTIDAVAKAAGLSKGGVLYHFPSKASLIEALIDRSIAAIDAVFLAAEKGRATSGDTTTPYAVIRRHLERQPIELHSCLMSLTNASALEIYRRKLLELAGQRLAAGIDRASIDTVLILLFGVLGKRLLRFELR
ncbi:helix-turn-helix transcriptional regulator [Mesorhizobium sp. CGMCC 1.15528]|uniref:Helix-turn-helix transcriptional regulator n=1 Tax=Mesorhizobium zhangyense TaxID=1776730 RepID=A0A7C9R9F5_9HYPH|nr:helix-turn-helix transcriptional regulator [Mesorhizobium zhangyense]